MISITLPFKIINWQTISFPSTLYLNPVLDLLLAKVPPKLHTEIRLGLQEALVNAAKHGNGLDPSKKVIVRFSYYRGEYCWLICDQGDGFCPENSSSQIESDLPSPEAENGRGLYILHQIFDQVNWNHQGTEVKLSRQVNPLAISV